MNPTFAKITSKDMMIFSRKDTFKNVFSAARYTKIGETEKAINFKVDYFDLELTDPKIKVSMEMFSQEFLEKEKANYALDMKTWIPKSLIAFQDGEMIGMADFKLNL